MKRFTALVLAMILLFAAGCSSKKEDEAKKTDTPVAEEVVVESDWTELSNSKFRVVECVFDANLTGQDEEYYDVAFAPSERKYVYVDLVLEVENTGDKPFGKENISAYFMYDDLRYDMEFSLEGKNSKGCSSTEYINVGGVSTKVDRTIKSGDIDFLHMSVYGIEKEAVGSDITVIYTIDGKEFEEKVAVKEEKDLLTSKTEVKVGDVVDVNGRYSFEVLDCDIKKYLQATNLAESEQYETFGSGSIVDLKIKFTNNTKFTAEKIEPYAVLNDQIYKGECGVEYDNNTKISGVLGAKENPTLDAGSDNICHLYFAGVEEADADNFIVRFNVGGVCYYCKVTAA